MNNVLESPASAALAPMLGQPVLTGTILQRGAASPIGRTGADAMTLLRPPEENGAGFEYSPASGISGILSQLAGIISQLLSMLGLSFGNAQAANQPQTYFSNATASSTGDPHLAFQGTAANGASQQTRFDSMVNHRDLLESSSFAGGYRVATKVTKPDARGVTYNREATVSTGFGQTQIELDNQGNASIRENGQTRAIAKGQNIDLGNGERVARNADGSLQIVDANGMGGSITTLLTQNGSGVDVSVQSQNVDLGGDLLQGVPPAP